MTYLVTLDRDSLKAAVKASLSQRIAAVAAGDVPHSNRDYMYSPSRWWTDEAHTDRHTLSTSASFSIAGDVITIHLNYSF